MTKWEKVVVQSTPLTQKNRSVPATRVTPFGTTVHEVSFVDPMRYERELQTQIATDLCFFADWKREEQIVYLLR